MKALSQVHKEGIIHRDISPDNIIIQKRGKTVLLDFGSARQSLGEETKSLTVLLKHGYAPVEQYQSQGKQGPYTDVYALCATMYWMVSGQKPVEAIERLVQDTLVPLKERMYKGEKLAVSEGFSDIVAKGMAVKREERYQSVSGVLRDINKLSKEKITEEEVEKRKTQFVNPVLTEENITTDWNIWDLSFIFVWFALLITGGYIFFEVFL